MAAGRLLVAALHGLGGAVHGLLGHREVGERQLGVDDVDVRNRVDASGHVHDVVVVEAAHHVRDRVGLADVREKLVAETLALRGAGHQAGDVDELDGRRQDLLGVRDIGQQREARIGHGHHADVGIDGAERVVLGRDLRARERVEKRGLAHVGEADDAALDAHGAASVCR